MGTKQCAVVVFWRRGGGRGARSARGGSHHAASEFGQDNHEQQKSCRRSSEERKKEYSFAKQCDCDHISVASSSTVITLALQAVQVQKMKGEGMLSRAVSSSSSRGSNHELGVLEPDLCDGAALWETPRLPTQHCITRAEAPMDEGTQTEGESRNKATEALLPAGCQMIAQGWPVGWQSSS